MGSPPIGEATGSGSVPLTLHDQVRRLKRRQGVWWRVLGAFKRWSRRSYGICGGADGHPRCGQRATWGACEQDEAVYERSSTWGTSSCLTDGGGHAVFRCWGLHLAPADVPQLAAVQAQAAQY